MASTAIAKVQYNDRTRVLKVWFVKGGSHTYGNVPPPVAKRFLENPSGEVFNKLIRPNFY